MPEARDRRVPSSLDVAATLSPRRASIPVLPDPLPTGSTAVPFTGTVTGSGIFRHSIGGRRARPLHAPENTPPRTNRRGRGRGSSRSVLPSWYPRTPLHDITSVVRAIERRRSRFGNEDEGSQIGTPLIHAADRLISDPSSSSSASVSRAASEIEISPKSVIKIRTPFGSKIPKIVLDISTLSEEGDSEFLTPQKKLLNSIDTVEMVVREELMKLKRTPTAKKAEREKRVRTLMSMR